MINKNMFKINKKHNSQILSSLYISSKYINPLRDWIFLLVISFIIIVCFIFFDYSIYKKIIVGEMYVSVEEKELTLEKLDKKNIGELLDDFNRRVDYISKSKVLKNPDPSI